MATAAARDVVVSDTTDKDTLFELKKKNESLEMEVERLTNLCKKSERKRRKQKVVYEKNMENLSIRLTDFETNLRREQKEIQELIANKDDQIKVRDDLVKSLRDKLAQHGYREGTSDVVVQRLEINTIDGDERVKEEEIVRQLPQLDLPPPEEKPNIAFTDHRPFRPKSKLSPVAEESELSFGSSLRDIHADLTPDRFHAALTASLSLLNEDEDEEVEEVELCVNSAGGVETPANSIGDLTEDKAICSNNLQSTTTSTETDYLNVQCDNTMVDNVTLKPGNGTVEPTSFQTSSDKLMNAKRPVSDSLSSFCDRLLSDALKFANENIVFKPKSSVSTPTLTPLQTCTSRRCVETFSSNLIQQSFAAALSELTFSMMNNKDTDHTSPSSSTVEDISHIEHEEVRDSERSTKLRTAASKVADSFFSDNFLVKSLHQEIKQQQQNLTSDSMENHLMEVNKKDTSTATEIAINSIEKSSIEAQPSPGKLVKDERDTESCIVSTATRQDSSDAFVVIGENEETLLNQTTTSKTTEDTLAANQTQKVATSKDNENVIVVNNENTQSTTPNVVSTNETTTTTTSNNNSPETSKSSSSKKKKKKKKKRSRKSVSEDSATDIQVDNDVKEEQNVEGEGISSSTSTTTDNLSKQSSLDEEHSEETQTTRM